MNKEKAEELTEKLVADMAQLLRSYFLKMDLPVTPHFKLKTVAYWKNPISPREMKEAVDYTMNLEKYPAGLSTKSRKRYFVVRRQIIAFIARKMKYPTQIIGEALGVDHATVTHAWTLVPARLKTKDLEMTEAYNEILTIIGDYYKQKYGEDLPTISITGDNS